MEWKRCCWKWLILLAESYPEFPTFPHTGLKFRELRVKVKEKIPKNQGV